MVVAGSDIDPVTAAVWPLVKRTLVEGTVAGDDRASTSRRDIPASRAVLRRFLGFATSSPPHSSPRWRSKIVEDPRLFGWAWPVFGRRGGRFYGLRLAAESAVSQPGIWVGVI